MTAANAESVITHTRPIAALEIIIEAPIFNIAPLNSALMRFDVPRFKQESFKLLKGEHIFTYLLSESWMRAHDPTLSSRHAALDHRGFDDLRLLFTVIGEVADSELLHVRLVVTPSVTEGIEDWIEGKHDKSKSD